VLAEDGTDIRAAVTGDLDLHGQQRPVTAEVELWWGGGRTRVTVTATVAQSQWGVKPYTAFLGALRVADRVRIDLEASLPGS
jgi:polyisoprenoid-binding protein YceI